MLASYTSTMVDVGFAVVGRQLPRQHRRALADALLDALPWLGDEPDAGVHPINLATGGGGTAWLSGRSRLMLRLPRSRVDALAALTGATLHLGDDPLVVAGAPQPRELLPHRTLYAHLVAAASDDEAAFLAAAEAELAALGIAGRAICGRRQPLADGCGFSLMVDRLAPDDALRLLERGLGAHRFWGCGLFNAHRSAAAVGE
jgi:CRISPR-associated protein Cas6